MSSSLLNFSLSCFLWKLESVDSILSLAWACLGAHELHYEGKQKLSSLFSDFPIPNILNLSQMNRGVCVCVCVCVCEFSILSTANWATA
jgi:hypothetical protein